MTSVICAHDHDQFCFVCGLRIFTQRKKRYVDAPKFVAEYINLFGRDPSERIVEWSPRAVCSRCYNQVTTPGITKSILSPMEWFVPENHPNDCYFCQTFIPNGVNKQKANLIKYAENAKVTKAIFVSDEAVDAANENTEYQMDDVDYDMIDEDLGEPPSMTTQTASSTGNVAAAGNVSMQIEEGQEMAIEAATSSSTSKATLNPRWSTQSKASVTSLASVASEASATTVTTVPSGESSGEEYDPEKKKKRVTIELTQERMNDFARHMGATKEGSELLASHLTDLGLGHSK